MARLLLVCSFILAIMSDGPAYGALTTSCLKDYIIPMRRQQCGTPGISESDCTTKGCCYEFIMPGVPACFKHPASLGPQTCSEIMPLRRQQCGTPVISESDCTTKDCCYEFITPAIPACFKKRVCK